MMWSDYLPKGVKNTIISMDAGASGGYRMLTKLYVLVWVIGIFAAAATYLTGNMTPEAAVFFGFLSFGAVFMGVIGVLPSMVSEANHKH